MKKKPKSSENKAKDVVTRRIDIPNVAKVEIVRANQKMNDYLAGVAVGMGIKGRWRVDMDNMQFIVEDNQPRDSKSR